MTFLDVVWFIIIGFAFVAYLMLLFSILGDLLRDHVTSGLAKATWVVFLIILPLLTSLAYLIVRGDGMAHRQARAMQAVKDDQEAYIRQVAGSPRSPAEEIAHARALLDAGVITPDEFDRLKVKALS